MPFSRPSGVRPFQVPSRIGGLVAALFAVSAGAAVFPTEWTPVAINAGDGGTVYLGDPTSDGANNGRNIVGDNARPAFSVASDSTHFFFRMRLDTDPSGPGGLASFGWGILIDSDGIVSDFDYSLMINGTSETLDYYQKTVKTGAGDPTELADRLINATPTSYAGATQNVRLTAVGQGTAGFSGNEDYFLDVAIPLSIFYGNNPDGGAYLNFSPSTPLRFWVGVSNSSRNIQVDLGGTLTSPGPGTLPGTVSTPILLCTSDTACGGATSGSVCSSGSCVAGCRGTGGNGCPSGFTCSSSTSAVGACVASGAPIITAPVEGLVTNNATVLISGTAPANASVQVFIDGVAAGTTTASSVGAWSLSVNATEGAHAATARATVMGVTSSPSNTRNFTVDTTAPAAPVVTAPANGSLGNDNTPTFSGTAEPNSTVTVIVDGATAGTVAADALGFWSFTPVMTLADGPHTVRSTARDAAGNTSASSSTNAFTIDTASPAAPVVVAPANGGVTSDNTPEISGTAEANSTVQIFVDGVAIGTTTANASGNWSFTAPMTLTDGSHALRATATDSAGNTSGSSATNTFTVDTSAPSAPVVTAPTNGAISGDNTPTFSGTAEANSTVTVIIDGVAAGTTTADASGNWSFAAPVTLADGTHTVRSTARDAAGNTSASSSTNSFTIDTASPAAPVVTAPANASLTGDNTPTFTGTAEANSTVQVIVDGSAIGTAQADASGNWSFTATSPLSDGAHAVLATTTDAAGNVSGSSSSNSFTVDTTGPSAPVISSPASGSATSDSTPTITGTAEANSTVTVIIDGVIVGTTTASATGGWTFTSAVLLDGDHTVRATATDPAGNASTSSLTTTFTTDTTAPSAPVVVSPAHNGTADTIPTVTGTAEAGSVVTIRIDGTVIGTVTADVSGAWSLTSSLLTVGTHTVSATSADIAGNVSAASTPNTFTVLPTPPPVPVLTTPAGITTDPTPTFTGTSEQGSTVIVRVDGEVICTAQTMLDGTFSCTGTQPLREGAHLVTVSANNTGGSSAESNPFSFVLDLTAPLTPAVIGPADASRTTDTTPGVVGSGEPGSTITITIDGVIAGTTTVQADGTWRFTPSAPLTLGMHAVFATAADEAGNRSLQSNTNRFSVVSGTSQTPTLTTPEDNAAVNTDQPVLTGTAAPGAMVSVRIDGAPACMAVADASGAWTCTASQLTQGPHQVTAEVVDTQGTTLTSNTHTVIVDTIAPAAPVVTSPPHGSSSDDTTPLLAGTGEPLSTVAVFVDGLQVGTAAVDTFGRWSLPVTSALSLGSHTVSARSSDRAGNQSVSSAVSTFTITGPTTTPVVSSPVSGDSTVDATPLIAGTATPGMVVEVKIDGQLVCTATASPSGAWSCVPTSPLSEGTHTVTAQAQGDVLTSTPVPFVVDTIAPLAPVVTSPAQGAITSQQPELIGTSEPGARVEVRVDGMAVCITLADAQGQWRCTPATLLSMGAHTVQAIATDSAGNVSPPSAMVDFTVDRQAPLAPVLTAPASGSSGTDLTPLFTGTAEAGSTVTVRVDGLVICTAVADMNGAFSCEATRELDRGAHEATAVATDAGGNVSPASTSVNFSIVGVTPPAPAITAPAMGAALANATPHFTGTAVPGSTVTVREGATVLCVATADSTGAWSCTSSSLVDGTHSVTATTTRDGVDSAPSDARTFVIDTTAPVVVVTGDPKVMLTWQPEVNTRYECSINGAAFVTCTGAGPFEPGTHTVTVRATDLAGNVTEVTSSWTVESPVPMLVARGGGCGCSTDPGAAGGAFMLLLLSLRSRRRSR